METSAVAVSRHYSAGASDAFAPLTSSTRAAQKPPASEGPDQPLNLPQRLETSMLLQVGGYGAYLGAFALVLLYVVLLGLSEAPYAVVSGGTPGTAGFMPGLIVAALQGALVGLICGLSSRYIGGGSRRNTLSASLVAASQMLVLTIIIATVKDWSFDLGSVVASLAVATGLMLGWAIHRATTS